MRKIIFFCGKITDTLHWFSFYFDLFFTSTVTSDHELKVFFYCSRIHCYFTFTFFFHFRFPLLRGSSSAQLAALRSPLSAGTTVRRSKGVLPCGVTFSLIFFHFYFFHSVFTFYDVAAQQSNGQKGFCGVSHIFCSSQIFGDFGQIIRVPQSWFLKCRIGCLTNCSGCGCTLASHLFPTNRGSKA